MPAIDALYVHDTLPLVRDEKGGLRFAELGVDGPETWIADTASLPDAEMTLHAFPSQRTLNPWLAGAREFAPGNAIEFVVHSDVRGLALVLVIRHDRERHPGDGLNEVVALVDHPDEYGLGAPRKDAAAARERTIQDADRRRDEFAWRQEWAKEVEILNAAKIHVAHVNMEDMKPGGPLKIEWRDDKETNVFLGMGLTLTLERRDGKIVATAYQRPRHKLDEDLEAGLAKVRAEKGLGAETRNGVEADVPTFEASTFDRIGPAVKDYYRLVGQAEETQRARSILREIRENTRAMKVLKQMQDGYFILKERRGVPGGQMSPRSGTMQTVTHTMTDLLAKRGLVDVVWGGDFPVEAPKGSLWMLRRPDQFLGLSAMGHALLAGDDLTAERMALEAYHAKGHGPLWEDQPKADPQDVFAKALAHLDDEARTELGEKAMERLSLLLADKPTYGLTREEVWTCIAQALGTGAASIDPETGRLVRAEPVSETLGPRR